MKKSIAITMVILSALFWGANFNVGKFVVQSLDPMSAATIRFSLASILILIFLFWRKVNLWSEFVKNPLIYLLLGLIGVAGFNGLFFIGLKHTSAINGSLIMATNPVVTMLLASLILNERIIFNQLVGLFISFLGVIVVITYGSWEAIFALHVAVGDWIIFAANFCWALYAVLSKRFLFNRQPLVITAITMIIGSLILFGCVDKEIFRVEVASQDAQVYWALGFMAVFGSVLAYLFWNTGIAQLGASYTSIFFNLVPVFTALISFLTGHKISLLQLLGGLLVLVGVFMANNWVSSLFKHKK